MLAQLALSVALAQASVPLPGGPPVGTDYLAYDPANDRIWVPAGNTGNIDVVDAQTEKVTVLGGFATTESPRPNRPRLGPSSVTLAGELAWVGNRGDNRVCAFDAKTLAAKACVQLSTMPDGITYVAATKELWVTTPKDRTLTIIDANAKVVFALKVEGSPEGYAVDQTRGVFYTNLEDKDKTLAIDVKSRKVVDSWSPACGKEGPRGLVVDAARHVLVVACTDGAVSLDLATGKILGRLETGGGVDNLAYAPERALVYVASSRDGKLTTARVETGGALSVVATAATAPGARNPMVDKRGRVYVADSARGRLLVLEPAAAAIH